MEGKVAKSALTQYNGMREVGMAVELELVEIRGLAKGRALLVFKEKDGQRQGAIEMAGEDALNIQRGRQHIRGSRPGPHDVFTDTLLSAGIVVERFVIHGVTDRNEVLALLHYNQGGHRFTVDCRPSDGMAIAVRMNAPLLCEETVFAMFHKGLARAETKADNRRWLKYFTDKGDDILKS